MSQDDNSGEVQVAKLCDFGVSKVITDSTQADTSIGTSRYYNLENLNGGMCCCVVHWSILSLGGWPLKLLRQWKASARPMMKKQTV